MEGKVKNIIVTGIGTDVGKTIVSAILVRALNAGYWKPIQCGESKDTDTLKGLVPEALCHPEGIGLKAPRSPHHAAHLEGIEIDTDKILLPQTSSPLIIEGCGGLLVPLNNKTLIIDLFQKWECAWVVVARHYIGSINHTLLTLEAMKKRKLPVLGVIFNGNSCPQTEEAILAFSQYPCIGRLQQEKQWSAKRIDDYANQWKSQEAFQSAMQR